MTVNRCEGLNRKQIRDLITKLDNEFEEEKLRREIEDKEQKNEIRIEREGKS